MSQTKEPSKERGCFSVEKKQEVLKYAEAESVTLAGQKFDVSKVTIYSWRKQLAAKGIKGLEDKRNQNTGAKPIESWKREKVLAVKETDPGYGASQIRNQLRREGVTISTQTVRQVLVDAGFEVTKRNIAKKDYIRFEASRPLELAQIDICEFYIHKQKVYLVLLLDDYSRFLLNYCLFEQCNMELIEQMVSDAINRYGKMNRIVSDRGFVFHGWLEEVERAMSKLMENGLDLAGRNINLFNISLEQSKITLTIMGRKIYIIENSHV